MSLFSVGGNAGFALGPVVITPLVLAFGLSGTPLAALLPLSAAGLLVFELARLKGFRPPPPGADDDGAGAEADQWRPFARLGVVIAARSVIHFGLMTIIPLYFVDELDTSEATANTALTVMLASGAVGTLIGGRLADRFGRLVVLRTSLALAVPLMVVLLLGGVGVAVAALSLIGAVTIATFSVTVVMGHEYLPGRLGVASGITLGLAIGLGGVAAAALGVVADAFGLRVSLEVIAAMPLIGLAAAMTLPEARRPRDPGAPPPPAPEPATVRTA
jgi:FSR family fosmidomycin resistance protein-like MFS transporter